VLYATSAIYHLYLFKQKMCCHLLLHFITSLIPTAVCEWSDVSCRRRYHTVSGNRCVNPEQVVKAASPTHMDRLVVFTRWRQCSPYLIHPSICTVPVLPPAGSFWIYRLPRHVGHVLGSPFSPLKLPLHVRGSAPPFNTRFLESTFRMAWRSVERLLQGSRSWQTYSPTDRPRYSVCSNRPHSAAGDAA